MRRFALIHRCLARTFVLSLALATASCAPRRYEAPQARVFGDDVIRFYAAVDTLPPDATVNAIRDRLEAGYVSGATPGVPSFMKERIGSTLKLAEAYAAGRDVYTRIRPTLLALSADKSVESRARSAFKRINEWIPEARFPNTYLMVGRMSTGGTTGSAGLLIGLELFSRTPELDLRGLNRWTRESLKRPEDLVHTIIHESIHSLQRPSYHPPLLTAALREGSCDFIATLATGHEIDSATYRFAKAHERELWAEFVAAMRGRDWGDWLYRLPSDASRPPDLGYAMGYFICKKYYAGAADKRKAIRDMIEFREPEAFLRASGYGVDWAAPRDASKQQPPVLANRGPCELAGVGLEPTTSGL